MEHIQYMYDLESDCNVPAGPVGAEIMCVCAFEGRPRCSRGGASPTLARAPTDSPTDREKRAALEMLKTFLSKIFVHQNFFRNFAPGRPSLAGRLPEDSSESVTTVWRRGFDASEDGSECDGSRLMLRAWRRRGA